eukprot:TRINITY_DN63277_c0_g1_i1.p1 TRINITY_DN63277_c0_g1~~TRINITY_DN63277_c0_g1_i1.p1  ORF type:complete len:237 (+),score=22.63 TRINITY_DN63277_c0_g1_i1:746-1456(+)
MLSLLGASLRRSRWRGAPCVLLMVIATMIWVSPIHACLSYNVWRGMLDDCRVRAMDNGMSRAQVDCVYSHGEEFSPQVRVVDGEQKQCYDHNEFGVHMAHTIAACVQDEWGTSDSGDAEGDVSSRQVWAGEGTEGTSMKAEDKAKEDSTGIVEERVVRKPIEGASMVARLARLLKLKTTVRHRCTCNSGCHYCCVLVGLGGEDDCFRLVCEKGIGYCASPKFTLFGSFGHRAKNKR